MEEDKARDVFGGLLRVPERLHAAPCHTSADNLVVMERDAPRPKFTGRRFPDVVEQCSVCHSEGSSAAVSVVHGID